MTRKLAYIVEIETRKPIDGTNLARFTFKGSEAEVVASAEAFSPSDLAVYIEPGSILPEGDKRYGGLRETTGVRFDGYASKGILVSLGSFVGKEIECVTRPATPADVKTDDGSPITKEDIEGLEVADLFFYKEGKTESEPSLTKVMVEEGTDLTERLGINPVNLQFIESILRKEADECHNNNGNRTWEDWERISRLLLHVADDIAIINHSEKED